DEPSRERMLKDLPLPAFTEHTLTTLPALRRQLAVTRERGWSMDDEEHEPGIQCYGAAVLGVDGQPLAAISVTTLRFRRKDDVQAAYVQPLLAACSAISQHIAATPRLSSASLL
ncbi:MAG: IclR family transcriptional regulator, partial [Proteobacteria bacterium]|nr:IclR family transcriptional regulator [Pseudomonadota bacterium]